jgi:uncharacterized protein YbjT (DUF2867 family)
MNILIFGATGMVGQGVLLECLRDPTVQLVQTIGRTPIPTTHSQHRDIVHKDLHDFTALDAQLTGFDACFFCLGVSSVGMTERDYESVTYGITLAAAQPLARLNPEMTFIYVSGAGTDSSERGRVMWARVKGRTENTLLRLPFKSAYMFRPGVIQPVRGVISKTASYRLLYSLTNPILPLLRRTFPNYILTTEEIGRAMLTVARHGAPKQILETHDIRAVLQS